MRYCCAKQSVSQWEQKVTRIIQGCSVLDTNVVSRQNLMVSFSFSSYFGLVNIPGIIIYLCCCVVNRCSALSANVAKVQRSKDCQRSRCVHFLAADVDHRLTDHHRPSQAATRRHTYITVTWHSADIFRCHPPTPAQPQCALTFDRLR